MKLETPDTCHHGEKDRIMSIDFHPFCNIFVTAGGDQDYQYDCDYSDSDTEVQGYIKAWRFNYNAQNQSERVQFIIGINGHKQDVNCVRFSPNGQYLASGSDDKTVKIWDIQQTKAVYANKFSSKERIIFKDIKTLIGHNNMVFDVSWSNCCNYIVSASMDERAILWDVKKESFLQIFDSHKSFIQGVTFDPLKQFILTVGNDKMVKIWEQYKTKSNQKPSFIIKQNLKKIAYEDQLPKEAINPFDQKVQINDNLSESENMSALSTNKQKDYMCFCGQNEVPSFVKRPDWSPDGSFFLLPACVYQKSENDKSEFCVYGYTRFQPQKPSIMFKTENKPAICIRFCPKLFKRSKEFSLFDIPYKMHFAIAIIDMKNFILFYHIQFQQSKYLKQLKFYISTESDIPLCTIGNIHYALLTDLTWHADEALAVSSSDGFISLCVFEKKNGVSELGEQLKEEDMEDEKLKECIFKQDYYKDRPELYRRFGQVTGKQQQQSMVGQTLGSIEFKPGGGKKINPVYFKQ